MPTCILGLMRRRGNCAAEKGLEGKTAGQEAIPASKRALGRFNRRLLSDHQSNSFNRSHAANTKLTLTKGEKEII